MAYNSKALNLVKANVGTDQGGSVWSYWNPDDDAAAAIVAAGYISDAVDKGLQNKDIVIAVLDTGGVEDYGVTLLGLTTTVLVP